MESQLVQKGITNHWFRGSIFLIYAVLLNCTVLFSFTFAQMLHPDKPDTAKKCAICHFQWVYPFYTEHRDGELISHPEEKVVASAEMCFSCHDGSIADSRKIVFHDPGHREGVLPSEKITIPDTFPLSDQGRLQCSTCHTPHALASEAGEDIEVFLRISDRESNLCRICHQDKNSGPKKGNHSITVSAKTQPTKILEYGGRFGDAIPNEIICETCHLAHGGFTTNRLVLPVDRPEQHPVLCETCHGKTPGLNENVRRNRFSHSVDLKIENSQIPKQWESGKEIILGSKGEILCVTCHAIHNHTGNESLLAEKNDHDSLCLQCHPSQEFSIKGSKHDVRIVAPDAKNIRGQTVSQSGPCSCCHLTHEGVGPFMWARQWKDEKAVPIGICKSCHTSGKCAEDVPIPETGHPIGVNSKNTHRAIDFPLFTETGKEDRNGLLYCSSCHNTHQWDPLNPENKGFKEAKGNISSNFLRVTNQDSFLCLGCHKEAVAIEGTEHDLRVSAPAERNILDQSPYTSGICGTCHLAHGGNEVLMWGRELTGDFEPIMLQICLECHREGSCGQEKQVKDYSHPLSVTLKNTQKITLPLYSLEGKQRRDGMVFCSTCHNSHQWNPSNPDKVGKDGTSSDSFLRLSNAGNSPLCAACHQNKGYIEGTEHDLRVSAPDEKNKHDLLPEESSLCGQCHAVHNARINSFVWDRKIGPLVLEDWNEKFATPENLMVGLCTSCHSKDACAAEKIPEHGLHPTRLYIALTNKTPDAVNQEQYEELVNTFPVFTHRGEKSTEGDIVCATCHDPHIWDAHNLNKGIGQALEGNATNSFLRKDVASIFCTRCHGEDILYKFKYFHTIKGRKKEEITAEEDE